MDEEQINTLLNDHGFFKQDPEPEPEPDPTDETKEEL